MSLYTFVYNRDWSIGLYVTFQLVNSLGIILRSVIINTHVQFFPAKINFCLLMVWLFPARTVLSQTDEWLHFLKGNYPFSLGSKFDFLPLCIHFSDISEIVI